MSKKGRMRKQSTSFSKNRGVMRTDTRFDWCIVRVDVVFTKIPLVFERLVTDETRNSLTRSVNVDHVNTEVPRATEPTVTNGTDLGRRLSRRPILCNHNQRDVI